VNKRRIPMSPALADVGFDVERLRVLELYELAGRLEKLEKTDGEAARQAASCLYLAIECVDRAAKICEGGDLLSDDLRSLMMVTGYRVIGSGGDDSDVSVRDARAAVRAVPDESAR
jgi:hypothetical protein